MRAQYKILATMAAAGILGACDTGLDYSIKSGTILTKRHQIKYAGTINEYRQGEFAIDADNDNVADYDLVLPWPPDTVLFNYAQVGHVVTHENVYNMPRILISSGNPLVQNSIFTINGLTPAQIRKANAKQR